MIPVFIGYDRKETIAYHVLSHSILHRSSAPVSIIPLNRTNISGAFWRERGEYDSTDFSNSRFIVPYLQGYDGWAIFMDCDMLCLSDIAELWAQRDDKYTVMVKKHNHQPKEDIKFLGARQTKYSRKNWSSLMMFNTAKCKQLTRYIVNTHTPGLWFHQFNWVSPDEIGDINGAWNLLVGYDEKHDDPKLVHYTSGGPWHGYRDIDYADEWFDELVDMMQGDNPINWREDGKALEPRQTA